MVVKKSETKGYRAKIAALARKAKKEWGTEGEKASTHARRALRALGPKRFDFGRAIIELTLAVQWEHAHRVRAPLRAMYGGGDQPFSDALAAQGRLGSGSIQDCEFFSFVQDVGLVAQAVGIALDWDAMTHRRESTKAMVVHWDELSPSHKRMLVDAGLAKQ